MTRIVRVEHLARVEGHGGITVALEGDEVTDVRFDVFEGLRLLEALVRGRSWQDVSQIVSRVCAICSTAHALTSIKATEAAFGVEVSPQTERLRELMLAGENIESHALHLFLLAAPDYLGYPSAPAMAADHRDAVALGLRLKKLGNAIQETVGGRMIHPVNAIPGGFGRVPDGAELAVLREAIEQGQRDVVWALDFVAALPRIEAGGDEMVFAAAAPRRGYGYWSADEVCFLAGGERSAVPVGDLAGVVEERVVPHSHAKHSAFRGRPFMVGSLARLTLFGDRLEEPGRRAAERLGLDLPSNDPLDNNAAQAVELAADVEWAAAAVDELLAVGPVPERPAPVVPRAGTGTAVIEAPRGILLHSYTYDAEGRVQAADVITPTALNAASVEDRFRGVVARDPGASDDVLRRRLEMVARAYDPCISCSVHLVRGRR